MKFNFLPITYRRRVSSRRRMHAKLKSKSAKRHWFFWLGAERA